MPVSLLATVFSPLLAASLAMEPAEVDDSELTAADEEGAGVYGPFFEGEPASDIEFATQPRPDQLPRLSVGKGAFCFVEGTYCRASLLLSADVGFGMRAPASDEGPDVPYAQFTFRWGATIRPGMLRGKPWHAWGVGPVASWSRGTGSLTVKGDALNQEVDSTDDTTVLRIGLVNQLWLSKRNHAPHLDFTLGAARSDVLTSGVKLWGSHAELAMGFGGWGGLFLSGDFLDRDTRVVMGFRGHGIAAGPIIAMAIAGLAAGGAL